MLFWTREDPTGGALPLLVSCMADSVTVTDPLKIAILAWFDTQLAEFHTRPQRWRAEITAEGAKITGSFSKNHQVSVRSDTGDIIIDGQVQCRR